MSTTRDPRTDPPPRSTQVIVVTDTDPEGIKAYRVNYRRKVTHPDYYDIRTDTSWRFCTRIVGLGRLDPVRILHWKEIAT